MNRKDYIAIATILNREYQKTEWQSEIWGTIIRIANGICCYYENDNERFDADKFMLIVMKE